jgi:hypothetical protein
LEKNNQQFIQKIYRSFGEGPINQRIHQEAPLCRQNKDTKMIKATKESIRNFIMRDFWNDPLPEQYPFGLKDNPPLYFKSFGYENPDKLFYVIWRDKLGSGFFSNLSFVLCHLKICESMGMIPVVDFDNFKTLYNRSNKEINNTNNAWEYYFKPVSGYTLEEIYQSKNVFFCNGEYPFNLSYNITEIQGLFESIYCKYISLQDYIVERVNQYSNYFPNQKILGVHFRGKEQNLTACHSFGPTLRQITKYTDEIVKIHNIERIFLVTEEQAYLDYFKSRYAEKIIYTDSYRSYKVNSFNLSPRDNHRFLLGLEILIDAILLSKCDVMLCSDSNVSEYAKFANNGKFKTIYKINNGVNSSNPIVARYLYSVKKYLPRRLGGLLDVVEKTEQR